MTRSERIDEYVDGPRQLREAVAGMTAEEFDARPLAGKMTTRELICHIADFELVGADRMKRVLAEDRPLLMGYDQDAMARALAYAARDVEEELTAIESVRRQTARILRTLPESAWSRTGVHSEAGEMTLEGFLRRTADHLTHHLPFIAEKRRALAQQAAEQQ